MPVDEFGREVPSLFTGLGGNANLRPADVAASLRRRSPSPISHHNHQPPLQQQKQHHHQPQQQRQGHSNSASVSSNSGRNHFGPTGSHYHSSGGSGIYGPPQPHHHSGPYHNNNSTSGSQTGSRSHYLSAPVASLLTAAATSSNVAASGTQSSGSITHGLKPPHVVTEASPLPHKAHPSLTYTSEPMMCEFVWKESELAVEAIKIDNEMNADNYEEPSFETENSTNDELTKQDKQGDDAVKSHDVKISKLYGNYRKEYCLHYIRSFFNKHLDDSWFRQRFSPLVRKTSIYNQEHLRALNEAAEFCRLAANSGIDFLKDIRLGNGIKQQQQQQLLQPLTSPRKGSDHNFNSSASATPSNQLVNSPPLNHLFSFQQAPAQKLADETLTNSSVKGTVPETFALHVLDIPSHVTDEHIALALVDQYNITVQAKHEQQLEQQQSDTQASHSNGIEGSAPKKGSAKPLTIVAPTLLRLSEIKIYPAPATLVSDGSPTIVMHRQVLAIGPAPAMAEIIISLKIRHDSKASSSTPSNEAALNSATGKRSVPRKVGGMDEMSMRMHPEAFCGPFDMEVECSDPYGRVDIDGDGRGTAPTDGQTIPPRKALVGVSPVYTFVGANVGSSPINLATANLRKQHPPPYYQQQSNQQRQQQHPFETSVVVLSAAVSSKTRIEADKKSAITIARALDMKKRIPKERRLETLIQQRFAEEAAENLLDLSIAYLRRVHLLSFYNGCNEAETIGDVMAGKHPCSTIHLRLQNADDYIQKNDEASKQAQNSTIAAKIEGDEGSNNLDPLVGDSEKPDVKEEKPEASKDMLVQRLDDSVSRALDRYGKCVDTDDVDDQDVPGIIDEKTKEDAKCIEIAEENTKGKWIDDHCIIDADGRARCSFHFCHKLFKDSNFLEKHLLKKHTEFLRADQASCHDEYMMVAWDSCSVRPVPPILVDCGSHFGCVSANLITGQTEADVVDPEPALWRQHEERRQRDLEMERKREESRQQQYNSNQNQSYPHKESNGNRDFRDNNNDMSPAIPGRHQRSAFVDVDDMKVEKVELSFDAVEVEDISASSPLANNKKKKKKKKLL